MDQILVELKKCSKGMLTLLQKLEEEIKKEASSSSRPGTGLSTKG